MYRVRKYFCPATENSTSRRTPYTVLNFEWIDCGFLDIRKIYRLWKITQFFLVSTYTIKDLFKNVFILGSIYNKIVNKV